MQTLVVNGSLAAAFGFIVPVVETLLGVAVRSSNSVKMCRATVAVVDVRLVLI